MIKDYAIREFVILSFLKDGQFKKVIYSKVNVSPLFLLSTVLPYSLTGCFVPQQTNAFKKKNPNINCSLHLFSVLLP